MLSIWDDLRMGIFDHAASVARRLGPAGELPARAIELYAETLRTTEQAALRLLRSRLDAVAPASPSSRPAALAAPAPARDSADPATLMARLLARSLEQDTASGRNEHYVALLRQLVPDEARIIACLAAEPPQPVVSVLRRSNGEPLLENASLVGRTAAVTLPSLTPTYVTKLLSLGLVELGPEDVGDKKGYELVLSEADVRAALKEGELGKVPAKVVRRTVTLSRLGRSLWAATQPGDVS